MVGPCEGSKPLELCDHYPDSSGCNGDVGFKSAQLELLRADCGDCSGPSGGSCPGSYRHGPPNQTPGPGGLGESTGVTQNRALSNAMKTWMAFAEKSNHAAAPTHQQRHAWYRSSWSGFSSDSPLHFSCGTLSSRPGRWQKMLE